MAADSPEAAQMALVSDLIAHICRAGFEDWYIINQLCDLIMTHELCALQSNLSLAEQLRVSANADPVLMRVARLWLILLRNCGHTYIEYNASPATKFIESLENVLTQHPDSHSSKRLARVLGSAVYDHAKMDVRHPYTVLWLKIKYPGQPVTGLRIPDSDPLLQRPTTSAPMSPETSSGQRPRAATGPSRSPPPQSPPTITVARVGDPERPAWNPYSYSQPEVPHGDPIPRPGAPAPNRPVTAPPPFTDSDIISGKPPYPWHPTRSYTNENADSWAKYYALGGTEPDGKVWFIPETLPVALGGRAQKHNQAWDPYRQARQNPGATAGPSQTQLKSPQSPLQAPELALPTISPKIAKREIVWDARPTAQDENPKRPNIKVPAATSKAHFSTSPVKSPEFLAMPYSSYNNNSTSDLENDGTEQPKKKKGLRHSMMASVRSSFDKVRTKDPLLQNEEDARGWEVIRERATSSPSPPESDPTSPFNNPPIPAFPAFPPRIGSPSPRLPSVSASSVTPVPLAPSASTPDIFTLVHSAATLDTHFTLNMSVTDFCAHVRASPHGRNAYLTKLVWHKELSGVKHEFMLVKIVYPSAMSPRPPSQPAGSTSPSPLRNDNGNPPPFETSGGTVTTWVRLDRAAQQGYKGIWSSQFRSSSAVFPANDTAMVSGSRNVLQGNTSKIQATIEFRAPPTLADLGDLLGVILEESAEYDLFKENCYFFCSVIQQLLREFHESRVDGKPLHENLGSDARRRITLRLRQRTIPFSLPAAA